MNQPIPHPTEDGQSRMQDTLPRVVNTDAEIGIKKQGQPTLYELLTSDEGRFEMDLPDRKKLWTTSLRAKPSILEAVQETLSDLYRLEIETKI
jgi:hypothetical protein